MGFLDLKKLNFPTEQVDFRGLHLLTGIFNPK